jgi:hypothetical protein
MDPQVTWDLMLRAYASENWPDVMEHCTALSTWLTRGGFPPTIVADPPVGDDFNFALALVACKYALAQAAKKGGQ